MTDQNDQPALAPKKKKSPVLWITLLLVIGLVGFTAFTLYQRIQMWASMGPPETGPAGVIVAEAEILEFADRIEAIGTAESDESTTISASETEIIAEILFEDGQIVKQGDLLIQLKDDEEVATYEEARKAYNRYAALAKSNAGSRAKRDEAKALMQVAWARVDDRKIKAPFDGILGIREVSVGDLVTPGTLITTIDDIDPIEVEFTVPEVFLAELKQGLVVETRTNAYPGQAFYGTITTINPRIDPVTRSLRVKARIDNPHSLLRPGLLMSVTVIQNRRHSLAVPEEALISSTQGQAVTVVTKDGENDVAAPAPVTIGTRMAGYVEILSGLSEGDRVVVEGTLKAIPGAPVSIIETRTIDDQIKKSVQLANPTKQTDLQNIDLKGSLPEEAPMPSEAEEEKATVQEEPGEKPETGDMQ